MKIIFLDIDGVLNCQEAYINGFCKRTDNYGQDFYPPSMNLLNQLIEETNAKIVISSTWRKSGLEVMQEMWKHRKMAGEVIDVTPRLFYIDETHYRIPRGIEIDAWLDNKGFSHIFWSKEHQKEYLDKSEIENYIIIDDDSDMLYKQKEHFVHVKPSPRNLKGFHEEHYELSKNILSLSILDMYNFDS